MYKKLKNVLSYYFPKYSVPYLPRDQIISNFSDLVDETVELWEQLDKQTIEIQGLKDHINDLREEKRDDI